MVFLIAEYNRKGFVFGLPGLALQAAGNFGAEATGPLVAALMSLVGTVLLIVGLCFVAKAKGYHWAFGLLGLLSCLGLVILAVLRDKTLTVAAPPVYGPPPGYPPQGPYQPPDPNNPYAPPGSGQLPPRA